LTCARRLSTIPSHENLKLIGVLVVVNLGSLSLLRAQSPSTARTAPRAPSNTSKSTANSSKATLRATPPDRDVAVYLPPSYAKNRHRRYPVVYFLHGYTQSSDKWCGPTKFWINLPTVLNKPFAEAGNHEMIFVTPNAFTRYQGSFYSNSVITGN
jgi:S-formylglutathione hydrolase